MSYYNIKTHKKSELYPPSRKYSFGKTTRGVCITARGNISLKLFMGPLETIELLIFWYVLAVHHIAQL